MPELIKGKTAIIAWNSTTIKNIKREILFFDELYYDPYLDFLHEKLLKSVGELVNTETRVLNDISDAQNVLKSEKILKVFEFDKFKTNPKNFIGITKQQKKSLIKTVEEYDFFHTSFMEIYEKSVELLTNDHRKGFLNFLNLPNEFDKFSDAHLRLSKSFLEIKNNKTVIPLVNDFTFSREEKKTSVIRLIVNDIPTPDDSFTFNDVLDFRNDNDNRRRYLSLISWINKISKEDLDIEEISDEYHYLMSEFENEFQNQKIHKELNTLEILLKIPLEIAENLVKINWSKIPGIFIELKRNSITSYESEFNLPGKELAYIFKAKEKFNK